MVATCTVATMAGDLAQHIRSSDPKQPPTIDPRYFEEETDLDILVDAFKFTRRLAQMGPFQVIAGAELAPGPAVQTDEAIRGA